MVTEIQRCASKDTPHLAEAWWPFCSCIFFGSIRLHYTCGTLSMINREVPHLAMYIVTITTAQSIRAITCRSCTPPGNKLGINDAGARDEVRHRA